MASLEVQVAKSLPASPHQPQSFTYPKRAFGKKTVVYRSFQTQWYRSWSWLHYQEPNDSVLCYLCSKAIRQNKMRPSNPDSAFVSYKTSYLTRAYLMIFRYQKGSQIGKMPLLPFGIMKIVSATRKL